MENVKITSFELENVKRVRLVSLSPSAEGLTVIGGRNCQGKTSVLDGIAFALGGERFRPSGLQNTDGMATARMEVTLSNGLKVSRSGKNAALKVTDPMGRKAGQKLLDSFVEEIALDLPRFLQANAKAKAETLLRLLGIQETLEALEREERKWYDERTLAGREADRRRKYADELPEYPDAPEEPLSAADMSARLTEALKENARRQGLRDRRDQLERLLRDRQERLAYILKQAEDAKKAVDDALKEWNEADQDIPEDLDTTALQSELERIDAVNAQVRTNMDKRAAIEQAEDAEEAVRALTAKVEEARARKAALLQGAQMPLEGLGVQDGELVYNGQKWDCMSTMEQMVVGTAICRALKPQCGFVLLDRLETFDPGQLARFGEWLKAMGMQAIGTRVATDGTCDIVIEDGVVQGEGDTNDIATQEDPLGDW